MSKVIQIAVDKGGLVALQEDGHLWGGTRDGRHWAYIGSPPDIKVCTRCGDEYAHRAFRQQMEEVCDECLEGKAA